MGLNLREYRSRTCGGAVDAKDLHGLSCKRSAGGAIRHQQLNDLGWRALRREDTPSGLFSLEEKRAHGLTLVPGQGGCCLTSYVTVIDTLAPPNVAINAQVSGSAAQAAAAMKVSKYAGLSTSHFFFLNSHRNSWPYE